LRRRLVAAAEELAATLQAPALYLRTTYAHLFFEHLGFRQINPDEVPPNIRNPQFTEVRSPNAVLMVKP
jgi:N-acetylglutamate synthase-like GNAT family acetyltransferase